MSYTYATMEVSKQTFEEVKAKLLAAGYEYAVHDKGEILDMHGTALVAEAAPEREAGEGTDVEGGPSAESLYAIYWTSLLENGLEVYPWDQLEEIDRLAWEAVAECMSEGTTD